MSDFGVRDVSCPTWRALPAFVTSGVMGVRYHLWFDPSAPAGLCLLNLSFFLTRNILFKVKKTKKKVLISLSTPARHKPAERRGGSTTDNRQLKRSRRWWGGGEGERKRQPPDAGTGILHAAHGPLLSYGEDKSAFFFFLCVSHFATAPAGRFPARLMQLRNVPCYGSQVGSISHRACKRRWGRFSAHGFPSPPPCAAQWEYPERE